MPSYSLPVGLQPARRLGINLLMISGILMAGVAGLVVALYADVIRPDVLLGVAGGVLGVLIFVLLLVPKPQVGLLVLSATLPVCSLPVISDYDLYRIVGWAAFGGWAFHVLLNRRAHRHVVTPLTAFLLLFLVVGFSSALTTGTDQAWLIIFRELEGFGLYLLAVDLIQTEDQLARVLRWFFVAGAAGMAALIWLYVTGSPLTHSEFGGLGGERLWGLGGDPAGWGKIGATCFMIALVAPFSQGGRRAARLMLPLLAAVVVYSGTRAAFLACAAGTALYFMMSRRRVLSAFSLALFGVVVLTAVVPFAHFDYESRIATLTQPAKWGRRPTIYAGALPALTDKPLLGWGLGEAPKAIFASSAVPEEAHNTMLNVAVETGIAGTLPFMASLFLVIYGWFHGLRNLRRLQGTTRNTLMAVLLMALSLGICAMFVDLERDPMLFFVMALTVAASRLCAPVSRRVWQ